MGAPQRGEQLDRRAGALGDLAHRVALLAADHALGREEQQAPVGRGLAQLLEVDPAAVQSRRGAHPAGAGVVVLEAVEQPFRLPVDRVAHSRDRTGGARRRPRLAGCAAWTQARPAGACPPPSAVSRSSRRPRRCSAARGYHGASLDEIAQRGGGLQGADLRALRVASARCTPRWWRPHAGEIFRRLQANAESGTTGEERLRGGVDAFLGFVEEHRDAWRALFRDAADPEVASRSSTRPGQAAGVVAALMAGRARATGAGARSARSSSRCTRSCSPGAVQALATGGPTTRRRRARRSSTARWTSLGRAWSACAPASASARAGRR